MYSLKKKRKQDKKSNGSRVSFYPEFIKYEQKIIF